MRLELLQGMTFVRYKNVHYQLADTVTLAWFFCFLSGYSLIKSHQNASFTYFNFLVDTRSMITYSAFARLLEMTVACIVTVTVKCIERNAQDERNIHDRSIHIVILP